MAGIWTTALVEASCGALGGSARTAKRSTCAKCHERDRAPTALAPPTSPAVPHHADDRASVTSARDSADIATLIDLTAGSFLASVAQRLSLHGLA